MRSVGVTAASKRLLLYKQNMNKKLVGNNRKSYILKKLDTYSKDTKTIEKKENHHKPNKTLCWVGYHFGYNTTNVALQNDRRLTQQKWVTQCSERNKTRQRWGLQIKHTETTNCKKKST